MKTVQNDLLVYYNFKLQDTIVRSRARWVEEGEKSTKYFLNLEKRNKSLSVIYKLVDENDNVLVGNDDILHYIRDFYASLYTSNACNPDPFFVDLPPQPTRNENVLASEGDLTLHECFQALMAMKNDKTPGSDGLSSNFYKIFWPLIGQLVVDSLNYGYRLGRLTKEQTRGIITLIMKPQKDPTLLKNYRPITLLNTDYKIGAKAIASRLKLLLPFLIGPQQTGFLSNRFIGENIRFILDLIDYCSNKNIPGFIFLADFEKAFDTLEWNFIRKSLTYF